MADLRVFLRKHGLSATGKKVELVQRVIDHLNSDHPASSDSETEVEEEEEEEEEEEASRTKATKKRGPSKQESDVDDEESDVDDEESDGYEESDDESEYEYDSYEADPDLRKILQRLGDCCRQRNPGLAMKEIDRFERELQANVREPDSSSRSRALPPRLARVSPRWCACVCSWAGTFASPTSCDSCTASATA